MICVCKSFLFVGSCVSVGVSMKQPWLSGGMIDFETELIDSHSHFMVNTQNIQQFADKKMTYATTSSHMCPFQVDCLCLHAAGSGQQ